MPRTLTGTGLASVLAQETDQEWVVLLTISHAGFSTVRYARRSTDLTSNGDVFAARHFELTWPDQTPGQMPRWQIAVDIVDQAVLANLRSVATAPNVQIDLVRAASPNTIEMTTGNDYKLKNIQYDNTMTAEVSMEDLLGEGFPGGRILPSNFPGGF